jgi:hypothetical protein
MDRLPLWHFPGLILLVALIMSICFGPVDLYRVRQPLQNDCRDLDPRGNRCPAILIVPTRRTAATPDGSGLS